MSESPAFDELVHNPVRLRLCVLLSPAHDVAFSVLRDTLGVADSVLSKHLKALLDAGYVTLEKTRPALGRPTTSASLTPQGRVAVRGHLAALRELAAQADAMTAAPPTPDHSDEVEDLSTRAPIRQVTS